MLAIRPVRMNVFVKPNEQSQVYLSYAMARKGLVYSNFHCLFCAKIRKSSDIYDKYGHFFTVSSILQRILFVFSQINPLLSPRTLPRHLVCRRKCLYVFQHTLWWNDIFQWKLSSIVDSSPFSFALSLFISNFAKQRRYACKCEALREPPASIIFYIKQEETGKKKEKQHNILTYSNIRLSLWCSRISVGNLTFG